MAAIFQTTFSNAFFLNENIWISIKISVKFVLMGPINNISAFRLWLNAEQVTSHYLNQLWLITDAYMRHSASMS